LIGLPSDNENRHKYCLHCNGAIAIESRFCKHCGSIQITQDTTTSEERWVIIQQMSVFYGIILLICCLSSFVDAFKTSKWELVFQGLMAATTITFAFYNWPNIRPLFRWPNFSLQKLCAYCAIAIVMAIIVHYTIRWLNAVVFTRQIIYNDFSDMGKFAPYLMIFSMAVLPAFFEELGFRGYLLQGLLKISDPGQAVFVSAFLFSIIHLSFLSLFWLIPFAWYQATIRLKENTIWYGVFIHFFFNLSACIYQMWP